MRAVALIHGTNLDGVGRPVFLSHVVRRNAS